MPLPLIPLVGTDSVTHQRRVAESINGILAFQHDNSRIRTDAEVAVGVIPLDYSYPPYHARRYGVVFDDATDNTTALNNAIKVCVQAEAALVLDGAGSALHGRLTAIPGPLKIIGDGGGLTYLKAIGSPWPYTASSSPLISSVYDFEADGVGFDQNFLYSAHGYVGGSYNDATSPSGWGGYFYGELSGNRVAFRNCNFINIARGFWVDGALDADFSDNTAGCELSDCQTIFATSDCAEVRKERNYLVGAKWTNFVAVTNPLVGQAALYGFGDRSVQFNHNTLVGFQVVLNGNAFTSERCVCVGNIVDTPAADTAFQNWKYLSIHSNVIRLSGDMGIACDQSDYVSITGNVIDRVHVGGINVGGCISAAITGNVIKDIMQGYALINTIANRYSSSGGAWGAAITCGFQSSNDGGIAICITGNSITCPNLPPVSDINGPIRASTLGIYLQPTTNESAVISGSVCGNHIEAAYGELPGCFTQTPTHRFTLASKTGTPIAGEIFTNGANSFLYILDFGAGNRCFLKRLVGTIPAATVFTGALSGATITTHATTPALMFNRVKDVGNIDWTEVA